MAGSLMTAPAVAKNLEAAVSPEMAIQKARMLTGFFSSDRLRQAMAANPEAVAPLETEARAKLAAGQAALDAGQAAEAVALFDAGMRAISRAVALGSSKSKWDAQAASHPEPLRVARHRGPRDGGGWDHPRPSPSRSRPRVRGPVRRRGRPSCQGAKMFEVGIPVDGDLDDRDAG